MLTQLKSSLPPRVKPTITLQLTQLECKLLTGSTIWRRGRGSSLTLHPRMTPLRAGRLWGLRSKSMKVLNHIGLVACEPRSVSLHTVKLSSHKRKTALAKLQKCVMDPSQPPPCNPKTHKRRQKALSFQSSVPHHRKFQTKSKTTLRLVTSP